MESLQCCFASTTEYRSRIFGFEQSVFGPLIFQQASYGLETARKASNSSLGSEGEHTYANWSVNSLKQTVFALNKTAQQFVE